MVRIHQDGAAARPKRWELPSMTNSWQKGQFILCESHDTQGLIDEAGDILKRERENTLLAHDSLQQSLSHSNSTLVSRHALQLVVVVVERRNIGLRIETREQPQVQSKDGAYLETLASTDALDEFFDLAALVKRS